MLILADHRRKDDVAVDDGDFEAAARGAGLQQVAGDVGLIDLGKWRNDQERFAARELVILGGPAHFPIASGQNRRARSDFASTRRFLCSRAVVPARELPVSVTGGSAR
jgi:hypothetical protein